MKTRFGFLMCLLAAAIVAASFAGCDFNQPQPGTVVDEAMQAQRTPSTIKAAALEPGDVGYFCDMDGGVWLRPEDVRSQSLSTGETTPGSALAPTCFDSVRRRQLVEMVDYDLFDRYPARLELEPEAPEALKNRIVRIRRG